MDVQNHKELGLEGPELWRARRAASRPIVVVSSSNEATLRWPGTGELAITAAMLRRSNRRRGK